MDVSGGVSLCIIPPICYNPIIKGDFMYWRKYTERKPRSGNYILAVGIGDDGQTWMWCSTYQKELRVPPHEPLYWLKMPVLSDEQLKAAHEELKNATV